MIKEILEQVSTNSSYILYINMENVIQLTERTTNIPENKCNIYLDTYCAKEDLASVVLDAINKLTSDLTHEHSATLNYTRISSGNLGSSRQK
jgi:hypothetical protein